MCVIIYKPKNINLKTSILKKAWESNPHGAGISYVFKDQVNVVKGFMTFETFLIAYKNLKHKELVIHFRYATHGAIVPHFTHPFNVSPDFVPSVSFASNEVLHHNGVLSNFGSANLSDTVDFISKILAQTKTLEAKKYVLNQTYSKFIIHRPNELILIGEFEKYKKCFFSNTYFLDRFNFKLKKLNLSTDANLLALADDHLDEYFLNDNWIDFPCFADYISIWEGVEFTPYEKNFLNEYIESFNQETETNNASDGIDYDF